MKKQLNIPELAVDKSTIPDLYEWQPTQEECYYVFDGENVIADYNGRVGNLLDISTLPIFYIKKSNYKKKLDDIVLYMNYFSRFFDTDRQVFFSIMSVKYYQDTNLDIPRKTFIKKVMTDVVTPSFITKCMMMAKHLYKLNIDADDGKYSNTPKITNDQAYMIVSVSFCLKILTPLMLHFIHVNTNFDPKKKTEYLKWFDKLFNKVIRKFESMGIPFYTSLCRVVSFRGDKMYKNNKQAFYQKKMLRGDTPELYNDLLIRQLVCVKTLYKLDYRMSCIGFIDGVIHKFNVNYLKENFTSKPYEIDSEESSRDSDDSLSNAEAMEMAMYKRDESTAMVADIHSKVIMENLRKKYAAFNISEEEIDFYYDRFYPNEINNWLFENFFAPQFNDAYAVLNINKRDTVFLIICMKKELQRYGLYHLAQLCTAQVFGRYRENLIKNTRFIDEFTSSAMYREIVSKKYSYLMELGLKDNPILKPLFNMINSIYILVDFDPEIDGYKLEHIDRTALASDFLYFLSMI